MFYDLFEETLNFCFSLNAELWDLDSACECRNSRLKTAGEVTSGLILTVTFYLT